MDIPNRTAGAAPQAAPSPARHIGTNSSEQVLIKGVAFRGTVDFIKARAGEEGLKKAMEKLPEEARKQFGRSLLATEYYPLDWLIALQVAACEVVGGDRRTVLKDIGKFAAENALTGVYKIFVKLGSPEYFFKKSSQVFDNYFRGLQGQTMNIIEQTKGYGKVQFPAIPGGHADYCRRLDGFFEKVLELSGGKDARISHTTCAYNGGKICEWVGRWT